ncbi:cyanogenic beta-glucosidase [Lathyrus oleraceus]|uniref:cyanogenic beta-glucosidase n=1 Tax=Pisum sativum TaxID=3888 RepID=UPI0021CF9A8B|nr:cyanogenic beta-glucosidase-like [Pisum sativum]
MNVSGIAVRDDFRDYVELCFKEFGDRVKHWITINEPWSVSMNAYAFGKLASGQCLDWLNLNCTGGDSGTEPYLTAHNQLLAHSAVANLYINPLTKGEYPKSMRTLVGKRLPKFSKEESRELKGSFDFLGLNYYSSYYVVDAPHRHNAAQPAIKIDSLINATFEHNGKPLGQMITL